MSFIGKVFNKRNKPKLVIAFLLLFSLIAYNSVTVIPKDNVAFVLTLGKVPQELSSPVLGLFVFNIPVIQKTYVFPVKHVGGIKLYDDREPNKGFSHHTPSVADISFSYSISQEYIRDYFMATSGKPSQLINTGLTVKIKEKLRSEPEDYSLDNLQRVISQVFSSYYIRSNNPDKNKPFFDSFSTHIAYRYLPDEKDTLYKPDFSKLREYKSLCNNNAKLGDWGKFHYENGFPGRTLLDGSYLGLYGLYHFYNEYHEDFHQQIFQIETLPIITDESELFRIFGDNAATTQQSTEHFDTRTYEWTFKRDKPILFGLMSTEEELIFKIMTINGCITNRFIIQNDVAYKSTNALEMVKIE